MLFVKSETTSAMETEKKEGKEEQKQEKEKNNKVTKGKSKKSLKVATVVLASKKMKKKESLFDGLADWMMEELRDRKQLFKILFWKFCGYTFVVYFNQHLGAVHSKCCRNLNF